MEPLRILHVTPSFAPATAYGGPVTSTTFLSRTLAELGQTVQVLTTNANGNETLSVPVRIAIPFAKNGTVTYYPRRGNGTLAPSLIGPLHVGIRWADIVHLTGVYSFPTLPTLFLSQSARRPVVWSTRGAFQEQWSGIRHRPLKRAWQFLCRLRTTRGLALHATSIEEQAVNDHVIPGCRSAVIPNGVHIPEGPAPFREDPTYRILFLGRLHPQKGIEHLIDACALLKARLSAPWVLRIAGSGDPVYTETLRQRAAERDIAASVEFLGYVPAERHAALFAETDVSVLPSYSESFGLTIAESLAHGIPVIASKGTPWQKMEMVNCGLWTEMEPAAVADALLRMHALPRRAMGMRGREWMQRDFSWRDRAQECLALYERLVSESRDGISPKKRFSQT